MILAVDQGTTSSRALLFDRGLQPVGGAGHPFPQHYPAAGQVEHDPAELLESVTRSIEEVLAKTAADPIALGIANQRETTLVWNRTTGEAIHPAIVWQCRRTADRCRELREQGHEAMIREKTGLVLDPYFSATKLEWILDRVSGGRRAAERGELLFGTVDSYLVWKLSGGQAHVTDYTNAARTMLFNLDNLDWDDELLALFKIPRAMLPRVVPSSGEIAVTDHPAFGGRRIPIRGLAGDQQAALHGQFCDRPGELKITYGTGAFLLLNTGRHRIVSRHGLLTTLGAGTLPDAPEYVLEGSVFMAGAIMQWLRDGLGILPDTSRSGEIAASVPDTGGVILVPAFTGLGAPYWNPDARAALLGMTRGTTHREIIRAAEEAIAYQCTDLVEAMQHDLRKPIQGIRVDGGASRDDFLMQFQADMFNHPIERPPCLESTVLGVARLAFTASGITPTRPSGQIQVFPPGSLALSRDQRLTLWRQAIASIAK